MCSVSFVQVCICSGPMSEDGGFSDNRGEG